MPLSPYDIRPLLPDPKMKKLLEEVRAMLDKPTVSQEIGAGLTSAAPLVGAGALATGAWAYPAKKLGEEIGWRIEEKKAGKRLRPVEPSFKQYAKYIPGAIAHTVLAPGRAVMTAIKKKLKKK
jgi:hypothetical protein